MASSRLPRSGWRAFGRGSPPSPTARRRRSATSRAGAWWALIAALLIVAITAAGVITLQERAEDHVRRQLLMTRFEGSIDRERFIARYALTEQQVSPTTIFEFTSARRQTDSLLEQMIAADGDAVVFEIRDRVRGYQAVVNDAMRLLSAGQVEQAYGIEQTRMTPSFGLLREATAEATLAFGFQAAAASRQANEMSVALVTGAVLAIGGLGWRVDRERRVAARLAGEHGALRRSEERFRALVQHASDVIAVVDREGVCRYASPAVTAVLGLSPEQAVDGALARVFDGDAARFQAFLTGALARPGVAGPIELRGRHADGADRTLELVGSHPEPAAGVDGVVLTIRDVTLRREAEAEMARALAAQRSAIAELERLNTTKSAFVAAVSHEFRTPLTSIQGFSELIRDEGVDRAEVTEFADEINQNAARLSRLIDQMLDLDRMESGRAPLRRDPVDLNAVAAEVAASLRPTALRHAFDLDLDPALPAVPGDRDRLTQVVTNLLANAVKFSPDGGEITLATRRVGDEAILSVRDPGVGVPADAREAIFERYARVEGAGGDAVPGSGLGLPIAREIVELHGGRIWVADEPGPGALFRIALPLGAGDASA